MKPSVTLRALHALRSHAARFWSGKTTACNPGQIANPRRLPVERSRSEVSTHHSNPPPPHLRAFSSTTTAADTAGSTIASATDTVRLTGLTRIGSEGVFASSLSPDGEVSIQRVASGAKLPPRDVPVDMLSDTVRDTLPTFASRTTSVEPSSLRCADALRFAERAAGSL